MPVSEAKSVAVTPEWLLERVDATSASTLGSGLEALIASGELSAGTQLPTIRDLAHAASVSVGTVLSAWNHLRDLALIETRRRGGTIVRSAAAPPRSISDWSSIDFQQGAPDAALQPELGDALLDSLTARNLNVFGREYMTERLHAAVAPSWPFPAEAWMTAGGGTEALLLATAAAAAPGSIVAVDEPAAPGFLDTLRDLDLTPVAVACDESGPLPSSLADAVAAGATAFVFQPGAPYAADHVVTTSRAHELADVLARPALAHVWVVEDDSIGPLAAEEPPTLGRDLPGRVLRVRSYCKAYGIDVRTSVLAGPTSLVDRAIALRSHGVGSNSRILQNTLAYLIRDRDANDRVADARMRYAARARMLGDALRAHGLTVHDGVQNIVSWVEVADETAALVRLAAGGIIAGAASKSYVGQPPHDMIRISAMQLPENDQQLFDRLAVAVADAARSGREAFG